MRVAEPFAAEAPNPILDAAPLVEAAPADETAEIAEPAPALELPSFIETAPVFEAAPNFEAAAIEPDAAAEPAPPPATVETTAAKTEPLQIVSAPAVSDTPDANKFVEAPLASLDEAQGKARSLADASLTSARAQLSQFKSATEEAASAIETSYATVKNGAVEFNAKAIEAFRATAEANFDFVKSVIGAKTPSEYVTLQSEFARKQIEALQTHTKAFGELAQKIATESVEPIKAQVAKTLNLPL